MGDEEQRQAPRVSRAFMVRHRCPAIGQTQKWFVSPLRDLSNGGARFFSEGPFTPGDTLEMELVLPASSKPVPLTARVAWTKPASLGMTELGVSFDVGDVGVQQTIDEAVAHFLRQRKEAG